MDAELKQHLEEMKAQLKAHTSGKLDATVVGIKDFIRKAGEQMETKILTEFHK